MLHIKNQQINKLTNQQINKFVFILFFSLLLFNSQAQDPIKIDLVRGMSPQEFVETHIANDGITVSNARFNNSADSIVSNQIGIFTNNSPFSEFPFLREGVILVTGGCELAGTANDGSWFTWPIPPSATLIDPLLINLIGGPTRSISILDFDFVSVSSKIKLDYIFASEEYKHYVCTQFIDGFGIFITGPDPENPLNIITRNIALIPGTDIPVGINTVNIGQKGSASMTNVQYCTPPKGSLAYSKYYIDNTETFPYGIYSKYIQYDGFTIILPAKAIVIPGQTYSMRISLANAGPDGLNDSGLFIKKKGFTVVAECLQPYNVTASNVQLHQADVDWFAEPDQTEWEIQYRSETSDDWTEWASQTTKNRPYTLTNLTHNTTYQVRMKTICDNEETSGFSGTATFKTLDSTSSISELNLSSILVYSYLNSVYVVNHNNLQINKVEIYDLFGRLVHQGLVNDNPEIINMNVPVGNYIVRIITPNALKNYKVFVTK